MSEPPRPDAWLPPEPMPRQPSPPEPSPQQPLPPGPTASGPTASGPTASGPTASGPTASGPTASGPTASGPTASGPTAPGPRGLPEPTGSPPERRTQRPHPLTPLIRGWIVLAAGVVSVGQQILPDGSNNDITVLPWWGILAGLLGATVLAGTASFFSWWYTQFVIDEYELRIETGMLTKSSKKIPFAKIQSVDLVQPLLARLFGLCELRIDVGGMRDSSVNLRYLRRRQAAQWRDYLLARAHGTATTVAEAASGPQASAFTDLSAHDQVLVRLDPGRLIGGLLLSTEFLFSVVIMLGLMALTIGLGAGAFSLGVLLPFVISVVSLIGRRVVSQFNYTLARTGQGLRVTRGLTNLTSQSIPVDRIQGVRIDQSLLWRLTGWYRVEIDVLGFVSGRSDERPSSTLLPVASRQELEIALAQVLPGMNLNPTLTPVPRRARWLNPLSWWTLRYGANDQVVVGEGGWLEHSRRIVPHAKTQSVRLTQGPLQRLNRLASVHVDTTPGPVTQVLHDLDAEVAYQFTREQLPRAAEARRRGPLRLPVPPQPPVPPYPPGSQPWPGHPHG